MISSGIYIYGIVFHSDDDYTCLLDSGVYSLNYKNISAIVSNKVNIKLDSLDRESLAYLLIEHQKINEIIIANGKRIIIPMQLGTILDSEEDVIKILQNGYALIVDIFKKIEDVEEDDVIVKWNDFSIILKEVSEDSEVARLKELYINNEAREQKDLIAIGALIKEKIDIKNKEISDKIINTLLPSCIDVKQHETMGDEMLINAAFLIDKGNSELFSQIIDGLDAEFSDKLGFRIVGPLPCYSFYTLEVKTITSSDVDSAVNLLGLRSESDISENTIKKAYRDKASIIHPDKFQDGGSDTLQSFNDLNEAYHTMLEYALAIQQGSDDDLALAGDGNLNKSIFFLKIKN